MNYNVLPTKRFEKEIKYLIKKFPSLKIEYATLIETLSINPTFGTSLGFNCYKAIQSKGKGKSGGTRVITFFAMKEENIYLLTIYDKSEQSNISDKELKELIKSL